MQGNLLPQLEVQGTLDLAPGGCTSEAGNRRCQHAAYLLPRGACDGNGLAELAVEPDDRALAEWLPGKDDDRDRRLEARISAPDHQLDRLLAHDVDHEKDLHVLAAVVVSNWHDCSAACDARVRTARGRMGCVALSTIFGQNEVRTIRLLGDSHRVARIPGCTTFDLLQRVLRVVGVDAVRERSVQVHRGVNLGDGVSAGERGARDHEERPDHNGRDAKTTHDAHL